MSADRLMLQLRLSYFAREVIDDISRRYGGISDAEVIRRALGTEHALLKRRQDGYRVLLKKRFRGWIELVWQP